MIKMILLLLANQLMLVGGQVLLKLGMQHNYWALGVGVFLLIVTNLLWLYLLKVYPFSTIYPLTSLGFVFGMISGMIVFGETVSMLQWAGVILVLVGCYCIAR